MRRCDPEPSVADVPDREGEARFERVKKTIFDWLAVDEGDPDYEDLPVEAHNELADLAVSLMEAVSSPSPDRETGGEAIVASREDLLDPAESARVMAEIAKENPNLFNQIEETVDRVAKFMESVREDD